MLVWINHLPPLGQMRVVPDLFGHQGATVYKELTGAAFVFLFDTIEHFVVKRFNPEVHLFSVSNVLLNPLRESSQPNYDSSNLRPVLLAHFQIRLERGSGVLKRPSQNPDPIWVENRWKLDNEKMTSDQG